MKTNFFTSIQDLPRVGSWRMTIAFLESDKMLISVLFEKEKDGKPIAPMVFNGSASELDEGFLDAMAEPSKATAELFASLDAYRLSLEKANAELKGQKEKKSTTPANPKSDVPKAEDKAERKKRYDELIDKAKKLNDSCKYADALAALPNNVDFPEKAEELDGLRKKLSEKNTQLSLLQA